MTMTMDFLLSESRLKQIVEEIRIRLDRGRQAEAEDSSHRHVEAQIQAANRTRRDLEYCLDRLSEAVRPTSAAVVVCCLESLCRQTGLNFIHHDNNKYFLSSNPFYIEISLGPNGEILNTKISHGREHPETCFTLHETLKRWDIPTAKEQLKSLVNLYSIPINVQDRDNLDSVVIDESQNSSNDAITYNILQALGRDLSNIANQMHCSEDEAIMQGPIGLLKCPDGGFSAKLTFFKPPMQIPGKWLADFKIVSAEITLHLLPSIRNPLALSTYNLVRMDSEVAKYCHAKQLNLSVSYCLKLSSAFPLSETSVQFIQQISKSSTAVLMKASSGDDSLLAELAPEHNKVSLGQVNQYSLQLEEETHYYFITIDGANSKVVVAEQILFNSVDMLISITQVLRRQLVYNTMVGSLVKLCSAKETEFMREKQLFWGGETQKESGRIFDISLNPVDSIIIEFQHPVEVAVRVKLYIQINPGNPSVPEVKIEMLVEGYIPEISVSQSLTYTLSRCLLLPPLLKTILDHPLKLLGPSPLASQQQQGGYQAGGMSVFTPSTSLVHGHTQQAQAGKTGGQKRKMAETGIHEMEQKRIK